METKEKVSATKFEEVISFRSKHNVLSSPLNDVELRDLATKAGRLKVQVRVPLDEIIDVENMEEFNNLIDDKVLSADATIMLSDMYYKIVGTKDGDAIIRVEAQLEDDGE